MNPALRRDNRKEPRRAADGDVRIWRSGPKQIEIQGRLVDISASGFRMAHECNSLETGELVEFKHNEASGQARVIWNRISGQRVETGFLLESRR